jgi:hypothetical protein
MCELTMKKKMIHFNEFEMKLICSAVEYSHDTWQEWKKLDMNQHGFDDAVVEAMAEGYEMLLDKLKETYPDHYAAIEDPEYPNREETNNNVDTLPDNVINFPVKTSNRDLD